MPHQGHAKLLAGSKDEALVVGQDGHPCCALDPVQVSPCESRELCSIAAAIPGQQEGICVDAQVDCFQERLNWALGLLLLLLLWLWGSWGLGSCCLPLFSEVEVQP